MISRRQRWSKRLEFCGKGEKTIGKLHTYIKVHRRKRRDKQQRRDKELSRVCQLTECVCFCVQKYYIASGG